MNILNAGNHPEKSLYECLEARDDDKDWPYAIGQAWLNDWSDPREDIYTIEDGKPVNGVL